MLDYVCDGWILFKEGGILADNDTMSGGVKKLISHAIDVGTKVNKKSCVGCKLAGLVMFNNNLSRTVKNVNVVKIWLFPIKTLKRSFGDCFSGHMVGDVVHKCDGIRPPF